MFGPKCILFFGLILTLFLDPISGRKGFGGGGRASYPKSGGLSGGGSHGYPSGGLSGSGGGSHGYPSGGLSGGGSHGYPSGGLSGGSHGSTGGTSGGSHGYPPSGGLSGGGHGYPSSGSKPSGSHGYPSSSGGLSGSGHSSSNGRYPAHSGSYPSHTTTYKNYQYSPPQQINYVPRGGGPAQHYSVYQGAPPTYVYQYKDSGSKYGTLLAGLALLNLGTLAGTAYAIHKSTSSSGSGSGSPTYTPQNGEICKFAIKKDNGDYDETRIDCNIISSFILQDQAERSKSSNSTNTVVTTTVTNHTIVNSTSGVDGGIPPPTSTLPPNVQVLLPNGTLIDISQIHNVPGVVLPPGYTNSTKNETAAGASSNTVVSSVVTTTITNTTVVDALNVKGKPIDVTPGMECFVISTSPVHTMKKHVPCGLLQTFAEKSIRTKSSAAQSGATLLTVFAAIICVLI